MDRLGPRLAAPSPGGAELHDEDVAFESLQGVILIVNAVGVKGGGLFAHERIRAIPGGLTGEAKGRQQGR